MSRFLITHSLLSSWLYALRDDPYSDATTERDPMAEFMQVLRRKSTPTNQNMQDGIDFEDTVMSFIRGVPNLGGKWDDAAEKIANKIRGGQYQLKASREVQINGMLFLLYGRLDVLKAGDIDDIKFSKSYDRGKYLTSTQHPMYFEILPATRRFNYLVSNGTDVWTETYTREETPSIIPTISDFVDWLQVTGYMEIYKQFWSSK